jgi:hypothetical protein
MFSDFTGPGYALTANRRSLTKTEKMGLLAETNGQCWVDYYYPGVCPQQSAFLTVNTVRAAHKTAHSRGGDDFVGMCQHCNAEQGTLPLEEYELILKHRYAKLQKSNDSKPLDKGTDSS